jgi:hypothetical protein
MTIEPEAENLPPLRAKTKAIKTFLNELDLKRYK